MGEVIKLHNLTRNDLTAADILHEIAKENPKHVFVIAWPEGGEMPTYHSTTGDMPVLLMRCQEFIHKYYNGDFEL